MALIRTISRQKDFEELDLPETVYKYRVWKNPKHQTILTAKQVWFAEPTSFSDPFDCKIPIRYDLLKEKDIYNKYLLESKEMQEHQNWTRQQHRKFARDWTKHSPIKDRKQREEFAEESFQDFNIRFGVLSLTANSKSSAMWTDYSADHTGFCVGYNPKIMFRFFGGGGIVTYYDELPIIMPTPIHDWETQHTLQVFSKLKRWQYEEEYRVYKFRSEPATDAERTFVLPNNSFKEIIFGAKIVAQDKEEIINIVKNLSLPVTIRQAYTTNNGDINIRKVDNILLPS